MQLSFNQHVSQKPALRVLQPESADASQLWAPKPEGMPECLVSLGRRRACELGMGVSKMFSPLILFRVWLNALHKFGTLNKRTLQKRLHVQKTNFGSFLLGPCISMIPFCIPDPHYFDMFWDLVSLP